VRAYAWFNLAAAQGNESAITKREIVRKHMTDAQIAEAEKLSRELSSSIGQ
jgi:TPR repeat protein